MVAVIRPGRGHEVLIEAIRLVEDGSIVFVLAGDPAAVADAIDRMACATDARIWMGKRARERYDSEFEADTWAQRLRDLYRRTGAAD